MKCEIHWPGPSKRVERLTNLPLNQYISVVEGKGIGPFRGQG